jgi:hypothetical protein
MDAFEEVLAAVRRLPEVEKRRLVAEVERTRTEPKRDTLRGFAVGPWFERAQTENPDVSKVAGNKSEDLTASHVTRG